MPKKPFSLPSPKESTELKGVTIKMPSNLHKRLMNVCQEGEVTMQDTINKMVDYCLSELDGEEENDEANSEE